MPQVSDLFFVEYGHSLSLNALQQTDPEQGHAYVSRTARNNGVAAYIERPPGLQPAEAGLLTVCLRSRNYTLATFVQPRPFFCGYHIHVLRPKREMTLQEKLWWAECITANRYRYNFGRQANRTLASLILPDTIPDWVEQAPLPTFVAPAETQPLPLQTHLWKPFRLSDLFGLSRGRNILRRDMNPGTTAYVSAATINNGITAMVDVPPDYPAGQITVASNGNGVGEAFYQAQPFVASGDVTVLTPHEPITPEAAMFVCTVIYRDKYRWNYGRKWVTSRMRESVVRLPVADHGAPDWKYMADYMRAIPLAAALDIGPPSVE